MFRPGPGILALGIAATSASMVAVALPPMPISGSLRNSYSISDSGGSSTSSNFSTSLNLATRSYIIQPWIASWNASFSIARVASEAESTATGGDGLVIESRTADVSYAMNGSGSVSYFPRSHFPGSVTFNFSDSRADGESSRIVENSSESASRSLSLSIAQRYRPEEGTANYNARYSMSGSQSLQPEEGGWSTWLFNHQFGGSYRDQIGVHRLSLDLAGVLHEEAEVDGLSMRFSVDGAHEYLGADNWTLNSSAGLSHEIAPGNGGEDGSATGLDVNTSLLWLHPYQPLDVMASLGVSLSQSSGGSDDGSGEDSGNNSGGESARLSLRLVYQFTEALRSSGGVTLSTSGDGYISNQTLSLTYTPKTIELSFADYNWSASANLDNQIDSEAGSGPVSISVGGSHSFGRSFVLLEKPYLVLSSSFNQGLGISHTGSTGSQYLSNGLSLSTTWTGRFSTLGLSAAFNHVLTQAEEVDVQVFSSSLSASYSYRFTPYDSLTVNFSLSSASSDQPVDNPEVSDGGAPNEDAGADDTSISSNLSVGYNNSRLFRWNGLSFSLNVNASSSGYSPLEYQSGSGSMSIDSRLGYTIGLLRLQVRGSVNLSGEDSQNSTIYFSADRVF